MEDLEYEDYYYDYDYDIEDDDYNEDDYIQGYDIILTGWNQSKKRRTGGERRRRCYEDEEEAKEVENILEDIAKCKNAERVYDIICNSDNAKENYLVGYEYKWNSVGNISLVEFEQEKENFNFKKVRYFMKNKNIIWDRKDNSKKKTNNKL
jgi:hypothetical protein